MKQKETIIGFTTKAGRTYYINSRGELSYKDRAFSGNWKLIGGRRRWNAYRISVSIDEILQNPERLLGLWPIDQDYGTYRFWQGDGPVRHVWTVD